MDQNGHAECTPFHMRLRRTCAHEDAREIRMYTSHADADSIRLRLEPPGSGWRHVSALYEIPGGWAWTLCNECETAGGERGPSPDAAAG